MTVERDESVDDVSSLLTGLDDRDSGGLDDQDSGGLDDRAHSLSLAMPGILEEHEGGYNIMSENSLDFHGVEFDCRDNFQGHGVGKGWKDASSVDSPKRRRLTGSDGASDGYEYEYDSSVDSGLEQEEGVEEGDEEGGMQEGGMEEGGMEEGDEEEIPEAYLTMNDDTPRKIAALLNMDVETLIDLNHER